MADVLPVLRRGKQNALQNCQNNIFLDALWVDVERMQRINQTISLIPPEARAHSALRPIEMLVIAPTQRLDAVAARHVADLPVGSANTST